MADHFSQTTIAERAVEANMYRSRKAFTLVELLVVIFYAGPNDLWCCPLWPNGGPVAQGSPLPGAPGW